MDDTTRTRARRRLVRWYRAHHRDLPWRRTRNPYHIWVAEIMLQQTRVDVVLPYYAQWLRRFPDVAALAAAPEAAVLRAWAGLGYYRRARSLHAAARRLAAEGDGRVPAGVADLEQLPGIGRYTAGAIASQAFGVPAPVVDGNVARVLSRLEAMAGAVESASTRRRLWQLAAAWARGPDPGAANQALMELGATLCTPSRPACPRCPLAPDCKGHRTGRPTSFPRPRRRARGQSLALAAALVRHGDALLLLRRRHGSLLHGWWEAPALRLDGAGSASATLRRRLRLRCNVDTVRLEPQGPVVRHGILTHRLRVQVFTGTARASTPGNQGGGSVPAGTTLASLDLDVLEWRWVRPARCRRLPLATLTRKLLAAASTVDSTWRDYLGQDVRAGTARKRRQQPSQEHVHQGAPSERARPLRET